LVREALRWQPRNIEEGIERPNEPQGQQNKEGYRGDPKLPCSWTKEKGLS